MHIYVDTRKDKKICNANGLWDEGIYRSEHKLIWNEQQWLKKLQERQWTCTYNLTLRCVSGSIATVEKHLVLNIMSACFCPRYPARK